MICILCFYYTLVMSIQSETSRISHVGNASNVVPYAVPFYFFEESDLVVVVTDENRVDEVLVLDTDFSVTGAGAPLGGELVTTAAVPSTSVVTIYRDIVPVQNTSYEEADAFPAKSHERALDRLTMLCQQLLRAVRRSYRVRESDGDTAEVVAAANTILGLDGSRQPRTYTTSELASFLNLTQQYFDRPMMSFSDSGERALAVPDYIGQLGTQRDDTSIWIADGTSAGNWDLFDIVPGAGEITTSMLAAGVLSADTAGRAKMADGFLSLAKIGSGIFTADTNGRGKFAVDFIDSTLLSSAAVLAKMPSGSVLQTVSSSPYTSNANLSTTIPLDDTIPQDSEGTQILSVTITPNSSANKLRFHFFGWGAVSANYMVAALFRTGAANALSASSVYCSSASNDTQIILTHEQEAGGTSAMTFTLRVGANSGTMRLNGTTSTARFGGVSKATLVVEEIKS